MIKLGFLTERKSAAILITPSSWGSQRADHSPHNKQHRTSTDLRRPHHFSGLLTSRSESPDSLNSATYLAHRGTNKMWCLKLRCFQKKLSSPFVFPEGDGVSPPFSTAAPSLHLLPPSPPPAEVVGQSPGDVDSGGLPFPAPWSGLGPSLSLAVALLGRQRSGAAGGGGGA
jgi:hypothetical protein